MQDSPDPQLLAEVFPAGPPPGFRAFRGKGCTRCGGLGTHGRIAVVEFLPTNAAMRLAISRDLPLDQLRHEAYLAGLSPMRDQALALVQDGLIAFRELRDLLSIDALGGDTPRPGLAAA
jgi:type IV pilus assembly protein PilB